MWGTLAATVVGALANDSGPTIFLIGATALVLAAAYVSGKRRASALT
jgi:1,4-dihydroxy-2-naphthoate octaprenyltransferase